jgi:hypothetical protein
MWHINNKKKKIITKGFFLHFMSYKSFEQKTVFQFSKKEASFQKWRKIFLEFFFFFGFIVNMSYLNM